MAERKGFVFYHSWWVAIENLPREVRGDVLAAIIEYGLTGAAGEPLKPIAKAMLEMVRPQIDANNRRYENGAKGRDYGKLGGAPTGNKNAKKQPQDNGGITPNKNETTSKQPQNNPYKDKEENNNIKSFIDIKDTSVGDATDTQQTETECQEFSLEQLAGYFNETMENAKASIPKVQRMTEKRRAAANARLREYGREAVEQAIANAANSSFLNGGGSQAFIASFDWIFRPNNFPKVLEGNYNNHAYQSNNRPAHSGMLSKLPPAPGYGLIED
ncbi:MAG: DUF6291 domain-containing protein [Clostridium sp.]|nr:DUF6291 domain-containing protein [Clostridium sp.]